MTGDGKTVLKANWGRFFFNPGVNLADSVTPTPAISMWTTTGTTATATAYSRAVNRAWKSGAQAVPRARRSIRTW